jgi:hypothetical protein
MCPLYLKRNVSLWIAILHWNTYINRYKCYLVCWNRFQRACCVIRQPNNAYTEQMLLLWFSQSWCHHQWGAWCGNNWRILFVNLLYKAINVKSLRNFRTLLYNSRDGHDRGREHVNKERERFQVSALPYRCSLCPPLVTRQTSILESGSCHTCCNISRSTAVAASPNFYRSCSKSRGIGARIHDC